MDGVRENFCHGLFLSYQLGLNPEQELHGERHAIQEPDYVEGERIRKEELECKCLSEGQTGS